MTWASLDALPAVPPHMEASLSELSKEEARYFRFSFLRLSLTTADIRNPPGIDPCEEKGERDESSSSIFTAGETDDMADDPLRCPP